MFQPNHKKKELHQIIVRKLYQITAGPNLGGFEFHFLEEQKKAPKCKQQYQNLKTDIENILLGTRWAKGKVLICIISCVCFTQPRSSDSSQEFFHLQTMQAKCSCSVTTAAAP